MEIKAAGNLLTTSARGRVGIVEKLILKKNVCGQAKGH